MQFEKTDKISTVHEMQCFYFAVVYYLFLFHKIKLANYFTINVVSFLSFILPIHIFCDIADATSFNITQSGRYHAL